MWPFGKNTKPKAKVKSKTVESDPLKVFDEVIASLEKQAAEARKSAATLLALRGELKRDVEKFEKRKVESAKRLKLATEKSDPKAMAVLESDVQVAARNFKKTEDALVLATQDSERLLNAAKEIGSQLAELQEERQSAKARMKVGLEVSATLKQQADDFERLMKLDKARDEVERAHALAELYREGK
jgi:phage shock protein A